MNGYIVKGFARKLSKEEALKTSPRTWYLPHHGVLNPNKPGKIRVVFDAASTCHGTSLNDNLMTGPDLLNSLFGVMQRFRLYAIAITADIEGMLHQVRVPDTDSDALRFLWKENIDQPGPPDVYKIRVHIFGATDSPTSANYALKKTALDNKAECDAQVVETVLNEFYVDDLDKSLDTVSEAVDLAARVVDVLRRGGFRLHKFMSNSIEFLQHIEESERTIKDLKFGEDEASVYRTLGLKWQVKKDHFIFDIKPKDNPMTKRGVVSNISQIFYPCGYLAPFTIRGKFFVQELWRMDLDWDETMDEKLQNKWKSWLEELAQLVNFKLLRHHVDFNLRVQQIEIHLFSDVSELGFGAVAYM
jgi:hypothetical protein